MQNILAPESDLFIFADGPKENAQVEQLEEIKKTREVINSEKWCKTVSIIASEKNKGLADSIITGVTEIINKFGKIIVLEDDIITSPYFLNFMNNALDFYANESKVWHISGYIYPIDKQGLEDAFFWRTMDCWGWATWKERWAYFKKDPDELIANFRKRDIYSFNINGTDRNMWRQVIGNKTGILNTWAIFWYAAIFQQHGLCLSPAVSFVRNIGFDGSGVHSGSHPNFSTNILCEKNIIFDDIKIKENEIALKRIIKFNKKENGSLLVRAFKKLLRIINKT
jgi:hypothetical protein